MACVNCNDWAIGSDASHIGKLYRISELKNGKYEAGGPVFPGNHFQNDLAVLLDPQTIEWYWCETCERLCELPGEKLRAMEERKKTYLERRWMHEPPETQEQRLTLLETISNQARLVAADIPPDCALCQEPMRWMFLYRCYQCGLWLCPMCAKAHFNITRSLV